MPSDFSRGVLDAARVERIELTRIRFPCARYQNDFVGFCHDVLGYVPWSKQEEIADRVIEGMFSGSPVKVLPYGGHKWGKSRTLGSLALWHYCSWDDGLVVLGAPGEIQLLDPLWKEVSILYNESGLCAECRDKDPHAPRPCPHSACIDGSLYRKPSPEGLVSGDRKRVMFGHTTRDVKRVSGHSGPRVLYILDESAGIAKELFPAIEGNLAGVVNGGVIMAGNPIDANSFFGQQIEKGKHGQGEYKLVHCSSWETPNATTGQILIPGLATRGWCQARLDAWGENDWKYIERVKGDHAPKQAGALITSIEFLGAKLRYDPEKRRGTLYLGVDLAGGSGGDLSVIAPRQGDQLWPFIVITGPLDEVADQVERLIREHLAANPGSKVVVNYDAHGIGYDFGPYMKRLEKKFGDELLEVNALVLNATGGPQYSLYRDELLAGLADALKGWLGVPDDEDFEEEALTIQYDKSDYKERYGIGKDRVERKTLTRKKLGGRSPDRLEAAAYSLAHDERLPTPIGRMAPAEIEALEPEVYETPYRMPGDAVSRHMAGLMNTGRNR